MELVITREGNLRCLYSDGLRLSEFGRLSIRRASHVEPTEAGQWTADLSPVGGPTLGPFPARATALAAEADWLTRYWLLPTSLAVVADS